MNLEHFVKFSYRELSDCYMGIQNSWQDTAERKRHEWQSKRPPQGILHRAMPRQHRVNSSPVGRTRGRPHIQTWPQAHRKRAEDTCPTCVTPQIRKKSFKNYITPCQRDSGHRCQHDTCETSCARRAKTFERYNFQDAQRTDVHHAMQVRKHNGFSRCGQRRSEATAPAKPVEQDAQGEPSTLEQHVLR